MADEKKKQYKPNCKNYMNESKCPVCGKLFYPPVPSEWAYSILIRQGGISAKTNNKWQAAKRKNVCSYACKRKGEQ